MHSILDKERLLADLAEYTRKATILRNELPRRMGEIVRVETQIDVVRELLGWAPMPEKAA